MAGLDGIGGNILHDKDWDDNYFILDEGLEKVKSNRCLENRFGYFLDGSAKLLGVDAFALGIDDIDTMPERGWDVLEILRRYLTSPRLVIFVAGDPELFSALVRRRQWDSLNDLAIRYEPDRKEEWTQMVDHLEDQYLRKILKPENCIILDSLYKYSVLDGRKINVANGRSDEKEILEFFDLLFTEYLFVFHQNDKNAYLQILLRQPIRTVVQVLRLVASVSKGVQTSDISSKASLIDGFLQLFSHSLAALGVVAHDLRDMAPGDIGPYVTTPLVNSESLDSGYKLFPDFRTQKLDLAVLALGAKVGLLMATYPEAALDYMLKVGLTREIMLLGPSNPRERRSFMQSFIQYAGLDRREETLGVARRATAVLRRDVVFNRTTYRGTVEFYTGISDQNVYDPIFSMFGRSIINNKKDLSESILKNRDKIISYMVSRKFPSDHIGDDSWRYLGIAFHTIETLEAIIDDAKLRSIAALPLQLVVASKGQYVAVLSVHNLIGLLVRILERKSAEEIDLLLRRSSQLRSYPLPHDLVIGHEEGSDWETAPHASPRDLDDQTGSKIHDFGDLNKRLHRWVKHWTAVWQEDKGRLLPTSAVAAMWTRFYYTLERYDENCDRRRIYAGDAFHNMIVAFFNAVLVEQCRYADGQSLTGINLQSSSINEYDFLNSLRAAFPNEPPDGVFGMIWSCPLWGYYLSHEGDLFKEYIGNASRIFPVNEEKGQISTVDITPVRVFFDRFMGAENSVGEEVSPTLYPLYNLLLVRRRHHLVRWPITESGAAS